MKNNDEDLFWELSLYEKILDTIRIVEEYGSSGKLLEIFRLY